MMKKEMFSIFAVAILLLFTIAPCFAENEAANIEIINTSVIKPTDPDYSKSSYVSLKLIGSDLYVTSFHDYAAFCQELNPHWGAEFYLSKANHNIDIIRYIMPEWIGSDSPVLNIEYVVHDVKPEIWRIDVSQVHMTFSGRFLISEGEEIIIRGRNETNLRHINSDNLEWVVTSATSEDPEADFFRLRLGETKDSHIRKILMCQGNKFDENEAIEIARIKGMSEIFSRDVEIPSTFWGKGLPEATYNPAQWPGYENVKDPIELYVMKDGDNIPFSFYNFISSKKTVGYFQKSKLALKNGTENAKILESYSREITGTPSGFEEDGSETWHGLYIEGIGAVGDWYASNLPYPVFNLPKDVTPSRLLYAYDYIIGELVYGDPTLDRSWLSVDDRVSDLMEVLWQIGYDKATILNNEDVSMVLYGNDGRIIRKSVGNSISLEGLQSGIYIIHAITPQGNSVKKIIR